MIQLKPLNIYMEDAQCFPLDPVNELLLAVEDAVRESGLGIYGYIRDIYDQDIDRDLVDRAVLALMYYNDADEDGVSFSDAMAYFYWGIKDAGCEYEQHYKQLRNSQDSLVKILVNPDLKHVRYAYL